MLALLAASHIQSDDAIRAVVIAIVLALVVWVLFHIIAPKYDAVAAIATFLLVLVVLLFL